MSLLGQPTRLGSERGLMACMGLMGLKVVNRHCHSPCQLCCLRGGVGLRVNAAALTQALVVLGQSCGICVVRCFLLIPKLIT